MRCRSASKYSWLLLASTVWLATAASLAAAPKPATAKPASKATAPAQPGAPDPFRAWRMVRDRVGEVGSLIVFGTGVGGHLLQVRHSRRERDLVLRIGSMQRLELFGLPRLLDPELHPDAYRCMKACITSVVSNRAAEAFFASLRLCGAGRPPPSDPGDGWLTRREERTRPRLQFAHRYATDPVANPPTALRPAYVICQQPDRCNLDPLNQLDPDTYRARFPLPGQEGDHGRLGGGGGGNDNNVNEFRWLMEPVANAGRRFAGRVGRAASAALVDAGRLQKGARRRGGGWQKAGREEDGVWQLVRHER
ncbi:MAG: hypothetical protein M1826_003082 [Phylliscum demangeonii]|nr:MAG: hypothetical protein M1826_003082 [Phylliscum demangeonii]